jgi:hypothetical protein
MREFLLVSAFALAMMASVPTLAADNDAGFAADTSPTFYPRTKDLGSTLRMSIVGLGDAAGAQIGVSGSPIFVQLSGTLPAFAAIPAFKIDQTTPGTTNLVQIGGMLPAFSVPPTVNLGTLNGAATEATASAINGKFGSLGQKAMAGSAPVVIANDQSAIPTKIQDGAGNALTSKVAGAERAVSVAIVDGSGNQVTAFGGSGGTASNFAAAIPAQGTAAGFQDIGGNMVAARTFNLNTGGSQQVLGASLRRSAAGGSVEVIGQTTMANSLPVTIASDQSAIQTGRSGIVSTTFGAAQTYTVTAGKAMALSNLLTITVFDRANQGGTLTGISLHFTNAAITPNTWVLLFADNPTASTCTNGSNLLVAAADYPKLIGAYNIVPTSNATLITDDMATSSGYLDIAKTITNTAAGTTLYACPVTKTTVTLTAGSGVLGLFSVLN